MADDNPSGAAPAAASVTTPAPAATITSPDALAADGNTETISLEAARKLRSEAESMRKRLKVYEDQEEQAKLAALSEVEKASKHAADLEAKIKQQQAMLVTAQIQLHAKEKGIINAELISPYVLQKLEEFGEDEKLSQLDKILDDVIKSNPNLVVNTPEPGQSPARTAAPMLPVGNPGNAGRSSIPSPGGQNPPGRIPRLTDPGLWKN